MVEPTVCKLPVPHIRCTIPEPVNLFCFLDNKARQVGCGVAQRQYLQARPHLGNLAQFGDVEIRDTKPPPGLILRQPLRLQCPESLAHRHMTGPEFGGDMVLPQPRARGNLARDDPAGKNTGNAFGKSFVCSG